ncbi:hypothetical protein B0H16DRAFT_1901600 [Mycena metata]|uniref:Protein kinase domain-containing protein n=1 Tax=Mycena metata TaxID=1033252 RepID=A0AAD7GW69_9AGAR|nr:hypothetical protein B0H16DRAFT_1901600 [Mycena metata]
MDTGTYSDDEYTPPSSPDDPIYTSFGGGMFAGSQYFTISGGTFSNHVNHHYPPPAEVPKFRTIPMGDIDLQQELMVNEESGNIDRRRERHCVRRVYSAKIDSRNTDLTVAIYEGDGAKEAWQQHIKMYMSLRHPNIVQMYGTAGSDAMYATIFDGDLIPFRQVLAVASPIITVYIYACYVTEWREAGNYVAKSPYFRESSEVDLGIHSTLCKNEGNKFFVLYPGEYHPPVNPSLDPTSQEAVAIHYLTLEDYHGICWFTLRQFRSVSVSSSATISSGVFLLPPNGHPLEGAEIAYLPGQQSSDGNWYLGEERLNAVFTENGWTRFDTKDVCNSILLYTLDFPFNYSAWLTQANHIFSRLRITSNLEHYTLVHQVKFQITIGNTKEEAPPGYLFLCLTTEFQTAPTSFRWPECPAYWSPDPSGVDRLSTEEATQLGFPSFQLTTRVHGDSWDAGVYTGLRQFHRAKGFDPDSQDVARHLGYPLYELSREVDSPFAHVEEDWSDDGTNDEWEDAQSSVEVEQDGDKSTENSDANEDEGPLNVCTKPIILFVAKIVLSCYSLLALVFSLLTYFHTLKNARILLVANTPELAHSTLAAAFALFVSFIGYPGILLNNRPFLAVYTFLLWIAFGLLVVPGYITYKRRTLNLEAKVNQHPFVEATVSPTCYSRSILPGCKQQFLEFQEKVLTRWYIVSFGLVPVHIAIMAAGLLSSNHVTYRFGKGMMPKAYRLSREAMAVIMEQYASQLADQYGADAAAHMIANNSRNTSARVQTHTRATGSGLNGLGSGSGSGSGGRNAVSLASFVLFPTFPSITLPSSSAQMPPNPFSPNPTPAASASDLNLAGPRPHQNEDGDEEGDGYSYGYGGVEEGDERGAGGQHAKHESLDIGAGRGF